MEVLLAVAGEGNLLFFFGEDIRFFHFNPLHFHDTICFSYCLQTLLIFSPSSVENLASERECLCEMPSEEQLRNGRFFAPISVPLHRRRQTFVMLLWLLTLPICLSSFIAYVAAAALTLFPLPLVGVPMFLALAMYFSRMFVKPCPYQRGRRWYRLTDSAFFMRLSKSFCSFFPCETIYDGVKDSSNSDEVLRATFEPGKRYLLCCHPHGLFGFGVWGAFVAHLTTGGHRFFHDHVFKKRTFAMRIHTMTVNFRLPVWRDWLLAIGFCDVDRSTLVHAMSEGGGGHAGRGSISVLVPGGAAESVDCDMPILTLSNRKGFVRIALETGCHLVPVYTFGETKLYRQWTSNGRIRRFLQRVQKMLGVGTPLVIGRGIFNYGFGAIPHRQKLTTIVGRPIAVPCMGKGGYTDADVDKFHAMYVASLKDLYAKYKPEYDPTSSDLQLK
jgi:hypothetical protein